MQRYSRFQACYRQPDVKNGQTAITT